MWNYVNDATGYRVINTGLIPITEKFSINPPPWETIFCARPLLAYCSTVLL
jgi:hypothetical protein